VPEYLVIILCKLYTVGSLTFMINLFFLYRSVILYAILSFSERIIVLDQCVRWRGSLSFDDYKLNYSVMFNGPSRLRRNRYSLVNHIELLVDSMEREGIQH